MKPLFYILFLSVCTSISALGQSGLRAGTAAVDISPTVFPMQLRSGKSKYVHDPLHVRAVAFENGMAAASAAPASNDPFSIDLRFLSKDLPS